MSTQRNKLGIFGGLFDPIHNGHLSLCRQAYIQLELDRVLIVPTYHPPHKDQTSDYAHRLKMVNLALKEYPKFELSELETEIKGPSYTVKTLEFVKKRFPASELYFIIGSDNLSKMESWYHPRDIFALAKVVMGNRPGEEGRVPGVFEDNLMKIHIPPVDISSTELREKVRSGKDISPWVPGAVVEYIRNEGLYVR